MCENAENTGIRKKINKPLIVISWWVTKINKVPKSNRKIRLSLLRTDLKFLIIFLKNKKIGIDKAI